MWCYFVEFTPEVKITLKVSSIRIPSHVSLHKSMTVNLYLYLAIWSLCMFDVGSQISKKYILKLIICTTSKIAVYILKYRYFLLIWQATSHKAQWSDT